ncbi:hypothetical protein WUBG_16527 [Wuchereria bancrofti]|uniref:Uncharacterized protein n=1 Tax=Wuchereria bancrofti TaxID=6293 RepID=J9EB10_WUCBA|nr:hypothetical protein WUBG_16527 [Wuchereria bancrofti]
MEIFRKKRPSLENIQRALQLLNVLVDNFQSPADEIHRQSLDVLLVQGIQFQNHTIQYYSIHALSIIVVHMDEDQLKSLIPRGLLTGLTTLLQSEVLFIVQKLKVILTLQYHKTLLRDEFSGYRCLLVPHYQKCRYARRRCSLWVIAHMRIAVEALSNDFQSMDVVNPNKPVVKEIMEIFRKKRPSLENIQRALQLLNVLVDNFQSPADEIHRQSLDVLLVQGIQFQVYS